MEESAGICKPALGPPSNPGPRRGSKPRIVNERIVFLIFTTEHLCTFLESESLLYLMKFRSIGSHLTLLELMYLKDFVYAIEKHFTKRYRDPLPLISFFFDREHAE
jgi:hypothetical protein